MYCVLFHPTKILFGTILKLGLQKAKCQLWQKRFFAALLIVNGWNCNVLISEWGMFYAAMWAALLYSMTLWVPCETRTHHDPQVRPDKRRCACWQPCQLHQRSDLPGIQVSPYLAILWFHSINFGGKRIPKTESFRFFLFCFSAGKMLSGCAVNGKVLVRSRLQPRPDREWRNLYQCQFACSE